MFYAIWYSIWGLAFLVFAVLDVAPISRETLLSLGVASIAIAFCFFIQLDSRKEAKEDNEDILEELRNIKSDLAEIKRRQ